MFVTFTDFGVTGPYLGQMKACLLQGAPEHGIIDLMQDAPAYNLYACSRLLGAFVPQFCEGTIFLGIIDPDVGSERKALCIKCDGKWFIGPDNGLFSHVIAQAKFVQAYEILWRAQSMSVSFHGRDLFAPIAVKIAQQEKFDQRLIESKNLISLNEQGRQAEIIYIDSYGNCWTDMKVEDVPEKCVFELNGFKIKYARVFCEVPLGAAFWYINSSGFVEFSINQGRACDVLQLGISQKITQIQ